MAKYTMELRELFTPIKYSPTLFTEEQVKDFFRDYELSDYLTEEQINVINEFGVWNKDRLAQMIVDHYYMREIGFETIGLFKHYCKVTMQELMEEYLPLIYSASIKYDPLVNVDFTETFNRNANNEARVNNTGESNSNSKNNSSSLNVSSDTPQGKINKQNILKGAYASSTGANENEASINDTTRTNNTTNSEGSTIEDYIKKVKGNSGVSATAQKMILQYRENIRAINSEIIKKLNCLFMGLY